MKTVSPPASQTAPSQTGQRVKVGMIGLAAVVLLIGLASAIFSAASRERPIAVAGAGTPMTTANMTVANTSLPARAANEPLAELGVAPGTNSTAIAGTPK